MDCFILGAPLSSRCNTLLLPFSFHICQFSLCFVFYSQSLLPSSSLSASLLFIHPLVPLSVTNASRCHISPLSICCPFICLLSLPPSCASSISLSPVRLQNIYNCHSDKESSLNATPEKPPDEPPADDFLLYLRHQPKTCFPGKLPCGFISLYN